jgi:hypothetical protein
LTSRRWISDRSRSAAVVLGNHPISVRHADLTSTGNEDGRPF